MAEDNRLLALMPQMDQDRQRMGDEASWLAHRFNWGQSIPKQAPVPGGDWATETHPVMRAAPQQQSQPAPLDLKRQPERWGYVSQPGSGAEAPPSRSWMPQLPPGWSVDAPAFQIPELAGSPRDFARTIMPVGGGVRKYVSY